MDITPDLGLLFWQLLVFLFLIQFIPWLIALIDVLRNDFKVPQNKLIWIVVLLLIPFLGWILYFFIGKHQKQ